MLTFRDLQLGVLRWIDEGEDTGTTQTLVKEALNRSHRKLFSTRTWPFAAWRGDVSFTTVPGQRVYALKHGISKVLTLWDDAKNVPLPMISRREWEALGVDRVGQQSVPAGVIYGDVWPVLDQPSSVAIRAHSTDSADADRTVIITGLNAQGDYTTETLTLVVNVGTASALSSTAWSHLYSVTKGTDFTGTLNITIPSIGSYVILSLAPTEYAKQYPTLEFVETPNEARTYTYTAQRTPQTLVYDYDIPDTPYPYSEIHVYDALLDLTTYNTELGAKEQRIWKERYDELYRGLVQSVDESIAGAHPRFVRNMNARLTPRIHLR